MIVAIITATNIAIAVVIIIIAGVALVTVVTARCRLLELSKTGTYLTYPYLESHESREPVPS